jgi:hypothetical protein
MLTGDLWEFSQVVVVADVIVVGRKTASAKSVDAA